MVTDRKRRRCRLPFIRAHPRYPWLETLYSPDFALVLVGLEDSTAPYSFSKFLFGSSIVAQMPSSLSYLVTRDRQREAATPAWPSSRTIVAQAFR